MPTITVNPVEVNLGQDKPLYPFSMEVAASVSVSDLKRLISEAIQREQGVNFHPEAMLVTMDSQEFLEDSEQMSLSLVSVVTVKHQKNSLPTHILESTYQELQESVKLDEAGETGEHVSIVHGLSWRPMYEYLEKTDLDKQMIMGGRIEQNAAKIFNGSIKSFTSDFESENMIETCDEFFNQKFFTEHDDFKKTFALLREKMARHCTLNKVPELGKKNKIFPQDATESLLVHEWDADQNLQKLSEMVKESSFQGYASTKESADNFVMEQAAFLLYLAHTKRLAVNSTGIVKNSEGSVIDLIHKNHDYSAEKADKIAENSRLATGEKEASLAAQLELLLTLQVTPDRILKQLDMTLDPVASQIGAFCSHSTGSYKLDAVVTSIVKYLVEAHREHKDTPRVILWLGLLQGSIMTLMQLVNFLRSTESIDLSADLSLFFASGRSPLLDFQGPELVLSGKQLECTALIQNRKGRVLRDAENFYAFHAGKISSFSTDLNGIKLTVEHTEATQSIKSDKKEETVTEVIDDMLGYKMAALPKYLLLVKVNEQGYGEGCTLIDKQTLKVLADHPDLPQLNSIFAEFTQNEFKLRQITMNEDPQIVYLCLEKKDALFVASFDPVRGYDRLQPGLLELKNVPTTHNLHGITGAGAFAIVKNVFEVDQVAVNAPRVFFMYVSLSSGEVCGSGSLPTGMTWQDKVDTNSLYLCKRDKMRKISMPEMPFFCGTFLEHLAPKISNLCSSNLEVQRQNQLMCSFVNAQKQEEQAVTPNPELTLTNQDQVYIISQLLASVNKTHAGFLKSPLSIWQSRDFYLDMTKQIKSIDQINAIENYQQKVQELVVSNNFAQILLNNLKHLLATSSKFSTIMGSVEAAEEYFFDVAGRILSTRLGQIELEPPLPKNEDDKFCEVWTGFAHLIGGDMLIDASAEALLRLLQPVRLMEESYLSSQPVLNLLTSNIEIVFNNEELLKILMTSIQGILSKTHSTTSSFTFKYLQQVIEEVSRILIDQHGVEDARHRKLLDFIRTIFRQCLGLLISPESKGESREVQTVVLKMTSIIRSFVDSQSLQHDYFKIMQKLNFNQLALWIQTHGSHILLNDCLQTLGVRICELVNIAPKKQCKEEKQIKEQEKDEKNPTKVIENKTEEEVLVASVVTHSSLLSGGIEDRYIAHLFEGSEENELDRIRHLEQSISIQILPESCHIEKEEAVDQSQMISTGSSKPLNQAYSKQDHTCNSIINEGEDPAIDELIKTLQCWVERHPKAMFYAKLGFELGKRLTRATFAAMLKMSGLVDKFEDLLMDFEQEIEDCEEAEGPARYQHLKGALLATPDIQESGILQEWVNATRMRKWFSDRKLQIAEEVSNSLVKEDQSIAENPEKLAQLTNEGEQKEQNRMVEEVVKKAQFLTMMQTPANFKSTKENKGWERNSVTKEVSKKISSFFKGGKGQEEWKDTFKEWKEGLVDQGQIRTEDQIKKDLLHAGTESVLICLQSAVIRIELIQEEVKARYFKACQRLTGFHLLQFLCKQFFKFHMEAKEKKMDIPFVMKTVRDLIGWLSSIQRADDDTNDIRLFHYMDDIKGCGLTIEKKLQESFFQILESLGNLLTFYSSTDLNVEEDYQFTRFLVSSFQWNYLARDFKLLQTQLSIFNLIFSGQKSVAGKSQGTFQSLWLDPRTSLSEDLLITFENLFLSVVRRITEDDKTKSAPQKSQDLGLKRAISKVDVSVTTMLFKAAFDQIFRQIENFNYVSHALDEDKTLCNQGPIKDYFLQVNGVMTRKQPVKAVKDYSVHPTGVAEFPVTKIIRGLVSQGKAPKYLISDTDKFFVRKTVTANETWIINKHADGRLSIKSSLKGMCLLACDNGDVEWKDEDNNEWEYFTVEKSDKEEGFFALKSHHGQYLCLEDNGKVICDRSENKQYLQFIDHSETFEDADLDILSSPSGLLGALFSQEDSPLLNGTVPVPEYKITNPMLNFDQPAGENKVNDKITALRNTERCGKDSSEKLIFPEKGRLEDITKFSELPTLSKIKYDIGSHIRCLEFSFDDKASEKAGGFSLDKTFDFTDKEVGKIICQSMGSNEACTRMEFFDREGVKIVGMAGSSTLNGQEQITLIEDNEKLVGFEVDHDSNVIYGISFVIAQSAKGKKGAETNKHHNNVSQHMCYDVMTKKLMQKYGFAPKDEPQKEEINTDMIDTKEIILEGLTSNSNEILQRVAKRSMMTICRAYAENDKVMDYLHMVLIFTSAASKCPYPLEMLSNVASPQHIQALFKLLVDASPMAKLTILAIIKNLVLVKVPDSIFAESLQDLQSINFRMPSNVTFSDPLVQFLYNLTLQIRTNNWQSLYRETEGLHKVSTKLMKTVALIFASKASEEMNQELSNGFLHLLHQFDSLQYSQEDSPLISAMAKDQNILCQVELEMLFEISGASLQTPGQGDHLVQPVLTAHELSTSKTCTSSLINNMQDTYGHEINLKDSPSLLINLSPEVYKRFLVILQRQSFPGKLEEMITKQDLHTLQASICKFFTTRIDTMHSNLSPEDLQSLASCLFNSVHIEQFCGLNPERAQHNYAPWLFESAYARVKALETDEQGLPEDEKNTGEKEKEEEKNVPDKKEKSGLTGLKRKPKSQLLNLMKAGLKKKMSAVMATDAVILLPGQKPAVISEAEIKEAKEALDKANEMAGQKQIDAMLANQADFKAKMNVLRNFMVQTGATLPEIVLSLVSSAKGSKEEFLEEIQHFVLESQMEFRGEKAHENNKKYHQFILAKCSSYLIDAKKEELEKIVVDDFDFNVAAQQLQNTQLLIEYDDSLKEEVTKNIMESFERFTEFKAVDKTQALGKREEQIDQGEEFKIADITGLEKLLPPAAIIHFLNVQLKRKLLNKVVYKFPETILAETAKPASQDNMINTQHVSSISSFKMLWFVMQHFYDQNKCRLSSKGVECVWQDLDGPTTQEQWEILLFKTSNIPEVGMKIVTDLFVRVLGTISQELNLFIARLSNKAAKDTVLSLASQYMAPNDQDSILKTMYMLKSILLVFCTKYEDEAWKQRKLELLFSPLNGGPSIFASMMQLYLNLALNMFEFLLNNPEKQEEKCKSQLWLRREALEACFRLLEIARTCPYDKEQIFEFGVQPMFESNLFQWLALALTEKLAAEDKNILEKDMFFYLSADLLCTSVRTYVVLVKDIFDSGKCIKIKLEKIYIDMAIAVNQSKVLPEKDMDLQNSLDFLTEIVKKQLSSEQVNDNEDHDMTDIKTAELAYDADFRMEQTPLLSFETEYDLQMKDKDNKNVPSYLFAKVSTDPQGKDYQLLTCSANKVSDKSERFVAQARLPANYAYVQFPAQESRSLIKINLASDGRIISNSNDKVKEVATATVEKKENKFTHVYYRLAVGDSSFHLSENGESFVNMKNIASKVADNGNRIPDSINFVDAQFDIQSRTFTGMIPCDSYPIRTSVVQFYRLEFSEDWSCIEGGQVIAYDKDGGEAWTTVYDKNWHYKRMLNTDSIDSETNTDSFDSETFKSLSNINAQLEMIPETMWINIVVPDTQKFRSHDYFLIAKGAENSGWDCDKIKGVDKCFSGLTGFYQSDGMKVWQSEIENYTICEKCMKVDILLQDLLGKEDKPSKAAPDHKAPANSDFITPAGHIKQSIRFKPEKILSTQNGSQHLLFQGADHSKHFSVNKLTGETIEQASPGPLDQFAASDSQISTLRHSLKFVLIGDQSSDPDNRVQKECEKAVATLIETTEDADEKEIIQKKSIEFSNHLVQDISTVDEETYGKWILGADMIIVLFDLSQEDSLTKVETGIKEWINESQNQKSVILAGCFEDVRAALRKAKSKDSKFVKAKQQTLQNTWFGEIPEASRKGLTMEVCELDQTKNDTYEALTMLVEKIVMYDVYTQKKVAKSMVEEKKSTQLGISAGKVHLLEKLNDEGTEWKGVPFNEEEKISHASISIFARLFVTESGELKQQGLQTILEPSTWAIASAELEKEPSLVEKRFFGSAFEGKILKTWQHASNCGNRIVYAMVQDKAGLSKLYSLGRSLCGLLGQGPKTTESYTFEPMAYESNEENQFAEIIFVGQLAMGLTTKGEMWVIGGEDSSQSNEIQEQEESKDEEIVQKNAIGSHSQMIFSPLCTGLMKQNGLHAIKVAPFTNHQKLILARTADGQHKLFLNRGKQNSEVKMLESAGDADILDFEVTINTVVQGAVEEQHPKDQFLEDFGNVKDSVAKQMEMLSEERWQDMTVPDRVKIRNHDYELTKHASPPNSGWNCNRLKEAAKCYSGLTGFYQSTDMIPWSDREHDFDLCEKCMKVDLTCEKLLKDEEKQRELLKNPKVKDMTETVSCLFLLIDTGSLTEQVKSGKLTGQLVSRTSQLNNVILDEDKEVKGGLMQKIKEEFKSNSFDGTISRILNLLNYKLEEMKQQNSATYMKDLKNQLVDCRVKLLRKIKNKDESEDGENPLMIRILKTFDGIDEKTILAIEICISIMKVNETLKLLQGDQNCLLTDPWRFDSSSLRENALTCKALNSLQLSNNFLVNELIMEKLEKIIEDIARGDGRPDLHIKRYAGLEFCDSGKVDHNETADGQTIFTQTLVQFKKLDYRHMKKKDLDRNDRPFKAYFVGESSIDDGGPLRETFDFMIGELQSASLPVLVPTSNNTAKMGEMQDCWILNPTCGTGKYAEKEKEMLYFFGVIIGYCILSTNPVSLTMHPSFWKNVIGIEYLTDESDLATMDQTSHNIIRDLRQQRDKLSDEQFDYNNEDMRFVFGGEVTRDAIEMCPSGKDRKLTKTNLEEFCKLTKEHLLNRATAQMAEVRRGIEFIATEKLLTNLSWRYAEERCCGKVNIDVEYLKRWTSYEGWFTTETNQVRLWFWEIMEDMSEEDKQMYCRFVNGQSRLPTDMSRLCYKHTLQNLHRGSDPLPEAHTCYFKIDLPEKYTSKEIMRKRLLAAIRFSGGVDLD